MNTAAGPFLLTAVALVMSVPMTDGAADRPGERSYISRAAVPGLPVAASDAVRSGNTLYIGGHLGVDPATGRAPAESAAEARLAMEALRRTVAAAGLQMDDLVAVTVFSTDVRLDATFNAVYRTYFNGRYPAQTFVGADSLRGGARFEVLGVAVKAPHMRL
ncbi:MAG TPA: RidA family protein [Steroidobacteraceae bacterium]|jgi:2-iminobutanoate/2-iminopropanoate deaminase